jgi:uncharacterized protein
LIGKTPSLLAPVILVRRVLRRPLPPWVDCALWLLTGWLAGLLATVAGAVAGRSLDVGVGLQTLLNVLPNLVGTGVVVLLGLAGTSENPRQVLALRNPPWTAFPWIALSSLCLALLTAELNTWIEAVLPMPPQVQDLFRRVLEYHSATQLAGVIFFLILVAPVTEELMFRGLFLHRLAAGYGRRRAILGSALCFGVFHILPWQAVGAALVGIYLGWLVARTRSLFTSIAAHAVFNLVPVVATAAEDRLPMLRSLGVSGDARPSHIPPPVLLISLLALTAGILGTLRSVPIRPGPPSSSSNPEIPPSLPAAQG